MIVRNYGTLRMMLAFYARLGFIVLAECFPNGDGVPRRNPFPAGNVLAAPPSSATIKQLPNRRTRS